MKKEKPVLTKTQKIWKWIGISAASTVAVAMALVIAFWLLLYLAFPTRYTNKTFNLDWLSSSASGAAQPILRVRYYSNRNKNGLEMLEVDWSYYQDTITKSIYSQGLQYVANTAADSLDFEFVIDNSKPTTRNPSKDHVDSVFGLIPYHVYDAWGGYKLDSNTASFYNYMSSNNYSSTFESTNPLDLNSRLKITIGGEDYSMSVKGLETAIEGSPEITASGNAGWIYIDELQYYAYYDFNYLSKILYNAVNGLPGGTRTVNPFEFGDYFTYYQNDVRVSDSQLAEKKVLVDMKTYCSVAVEVFDDGARTYTDSMFNMIKGDGTFNIAPDREVSDYFIGRPIQFLTLKDFNYFKFHENDREDPYVVLKLKDSFVDTFYKDRNNIALEIEIDIDELEKQDKKFACFSYEGLQYFKVVRAYTVSNKTGKRVEEEVLL